MNQFAENDMKNLTVRRYYNAYILNLTNRYIYDQIIVAKVSSLSVNDA